MKELENDNEKETIYLSKELNDEQLLIEQKRKELEEIEKAKEESKEELKKYEGLLEKTSDLLEKSEELSDKIIDSLNDEKIKEKLKVENPNLNYSMGKLIHNIYADTKGLLKIGIFGVILYSLATYGGNNLYEKDGILENLIDEEAMYSLESSDAYINDQLDLNLSRLSEFNKDVEKVLEKGYARESDDYLKSIYVKSKIVKEGKLAVGESTEEVDKLIKDLEKKLEIGEN